MQTYHINVTLKCNIYYSCPNVCELHYTGHRASVNGSKTSLATMTSELEHDTSGTEIPSACTQRRNAIREFTENLFVRFSIFLLVLLDIGIVCFALATVNESHRFQATALALSIATLVISCVFMVELTLRIIAWG